MNGVGQEHQRNRHQKQAERLHVPRPASGDEFRGEITGPHKQIADSGKNLGIQMRQLMQSMCRKMPEGKFVLMGLLFTADVAELS